MKKYLLTSAAALAFCGLFTSCTHDLGYDGEAAAAQNSVVKTYEQAFITAFGQPDPNNDWGFGPSVATSRAMTRALGDYDNYKGTMQPVEWYQDTNDNWAWKTRTYTFPSAPEIPTTRPTSNVEYYGGGYKYFNGETIWMDENTSKHVEVQGFCNMYVVKTGTGEGNVIIESTDKWYVGNVAYGQKIKVFVCPGVTLKIPANSENNLQANVEYYFAPGSELICDNLKLNGTAIYMGASTTTTVSKLEVNNSGIFYNMGTANITNDISVENSSSTIVNDGTLNAANLLTKGSGRVQNNAELTIRNTTTINSNYNVWVNNGYYKTKNFEYTATSASVINNCFLEVTENFFMNIADGKGDFKIDAGGGVLTKNFYGGGVYGSYNGGPYKITMGSRSVFKVTNEAHLNALGSGIATAHYGFEGVGDDYAVFQAKKVLKDGTGEGNVAYSGKLYVSAEEHFAQGYSGQYPYIHYYNDCSEANVYAPGFQSATPDISIATTPCNPGFNTPTPPTPSSGKLRIICEDLSVKESTDWDFNDVVFDIQLVENNQAEITLLAAGGTLPLYIGDEDHEVHDLFAAVPENSDKGITRSTMINTGSTGNKYNLRNCKEAIFRLDILSDWTAGAGPSTSEEDLLKIVAKNLPVKVQKLVNGEKRWVTLMCEPGKATAKVAVNKDFEWCDERVHINEKYKNYDEYGNEWGGFSLFVQGIFKNVDDWLNYNGPLPQEMVNQLLGQ